MRTLHAVAVLVLGCANRVGGPAFASRRRSRQTPRTGPCRRTEYGHPDIQGRWSNGFVTPLQRPEGRGSTLTQEEVAQAEQRASNFLANSFEPLDPNRAAPEATNNPGAYDLFYVEPGDRVAIVNGEPRSSLVTRPAKRAAAGAHRGGQSAAARSRPRSAGSSGEHDHPELLPLPERCLVPVGPQDGTRR